MNYDNNKSILFWVMNQESMLFLTQKKVYFNQRLMNNRPLDDAY